MTREQTHQVNGKIREIRDCLDGVTVVLRNAFRSPTPEMDGHVLMLVAGVRGACAEIAAILTKRDDYHASGVSGEG